MEGGWWRKVLGEEKDVTFLMKKGKQINWKMHNDSWATWGWYTAKPEIVSLLNVVFQQTPFVQHEFSWFLFAVMTVQQITNSPWSIRSL